MWSKEFNMHFGYYKFWMNPLSREPMLEEMNQQVFNHLGLIKEDVLVYDLGSGIAAPSRAFARRYPDKKIKGITIVGWQVEKANELNKSAGLDSNIEIVLGDYTQSPFESSSADGVYALESCCHTSGLAKKPFIEEMMRILKPGKKFVIVDGFIKRDPEKFRGILRYCYREICKGFALPSFPHIGMLIDEIKKSGGSEIEVRDFSFRIAPTAVHSPIMVVYFLIKKMFQGEKLNSVRLGHLKACFLGLVLGLFRGSFSYCLVTGIKK